MPHSKHNAHIEHTVLIFGGASCNWVGLGTILRQMSHVRVVVIAEDFANAVTYAEQCQPTIIFTGTRFAHYSLVDTVNALNMKCPNCLFALIGDLITADDLLALLPVGLVSVSRWERI